VRCVVAIPEAEHTTEGKRGVEGHLRRVKSVPKKGEGREVETRRGTRQWRTVK
jgi:hypothetical protein